MSPPFTTTDPLDAGPALSAAAVRALRALMDAGSELELQQKRARALDLLGVCDDGLALVDALAEKTRRIRELSKLATEDGLTGLGNRRAFDQALHRELSRRHRVNGVGLILLDLDELKTLNDECGHAVGDKALRCVGRAAMQAVRASDLVVRLGGDEFAVLLPDTDRHGTELTAERLRQAIESETVEGRGLRISVGAAHLAPADKPDAEALIGEADRRMYADKNDRKSERVRAA